MVTALRKSDTGQIHLLRAILRQCTYLPDITARTYFPRYILDRYRRRQSVESNPPVIKARKEARKALSLLIRANAGHRKHLEKVLLLAYGRSGKRRHELLAPLLQPSSETDIQSPTHGHHSLQHYNRSPSTISPENWLPIPAKLYNLLKSQQGTRLPPRHAIKQLDPLVPATNIWGRPFPKRRERNLRWKHHVQNLNHALPPLPEGEWGRLRDLVHGIRQWEGPKPRRSRGLEITPNCTTSDQLSLNYPATEDLATHQLPTRSFLSAEIGRASFELKPLRGKNGPRMLTPRFMRRMWAKIFAQCSVVRKDVANGTEVVNWGDIRSPYNDQARSAVGTELALFRGVSATGKVWQD